MKILNFGSCNIDYVYSVDHIVEAGETETSSSLETYPGGKGLNQSIAVAKAGANIYHAGCVGFDSEILTDILSENGVDISLLKKVDEKNGHAIIQVNTAGENSIFLYPGSNEMISKEYIDSVLEKFSDGDIILLQNEINNVDYIVDKAYEKNMCIILNPSPFNEKINKIDLNKITYIILNKVEAKTISGCDIPEESLTYIKNKFPNIKIVLTLGSKGCIYYDGEERVYQSAFVVEAVDTTAAGDTFMGYFVAGLAEDASRAKILRIASAASAISVSRNGAAPSIPGKSEVLATIDKMKENKTDCKSDNILKQIEKYIESNIKNANLKELSKILGYSSVYTGSLVKELTGKSFSKTVQDKRCSIAAEKLSETDLPIETIISEIGYENESFFRKIFKEKYGKNPLEYRKRK